MRSGIHKPIRRTMLGLALLGMSVSGLASSAAAEASKVRFADQIGLLYLPMRVAIEKKLVEKHAKEAGLGDVTVEVSQFSGGGAVNTAILSGGVDFAAGGIPPLLKLWDRTKGTDTEVRGTISLTHMAYKLFTIDPNVKTIDDYVGIQGHRIALPSVKVSTQAVTLAMAAEKKFGQDKAFSLDNLTVSMPHPQAYAAMKSGSQPIKSHFATLPFSYQLVKEIKARQVFSSYDVAGGSHTGVVLYNTKKWKDENPKLFKAVVDAFSEASQWIKDNPKEAAELFKNSEKSPNTAEEILEMISDRSEVEYRTDVRGTLIYAEFLHRTGDIKNMPTSWKDYFWESVHQFEGD
ncbi:ABC transporter substrate-binding protein [Microvirga guangxiensis]|uniref:NitT/TauT family transport system substrate-binding protein n=1 Tax=Microvirga guangxiensis TaxID=549386 RepID=A0A1G5F1Y7_9HYPH|nr:ABC transporter substrate-binding protein [Microvirga guangxiensis]SCY33217.1 NitT/TauT family transport system substrate-binding protein [Microvirga guangxiensis]